MTDPEGERREAQEREADAASIQRATEKARAAVQREAIEQIRRQRGVSSN